MKTKGKIQQKQIKSGETDGKEWKRCSYVVNNKMYSTFDTKFMDFKEGDEVEIEFETKGNFNNILNMTSGKKVKKYIITIEEV